MITTNTVFILGAGASRHCSYVLGQELYDKVLKELYHLPANYHAIADKHERGFHEYTPAEQLIKLGFSVESIIKLQEDLSHSNQQYIYQFL